MSGAPSGREEAEHAGEGVGGAEARGKMAAGQVRFHRVFQFWFRRFFDFVFHNSKKGLVFSDYFYVYSWTYREI